MIAINRYLEKLAKPLPSERPALLCC